jgi:glucose/arabinose dehydrogenase
VFRTAARKNARNFRIVLLDRIPTPSDHHVGGALPFGPDGKRYLGVGDGGTGGGPA